MKRLLLLLAVIVTIAANCHHRFGHEVIGSGVRQMQKRDVPAFTAISTEGAFDITIVCQKPQNLEVEGDDNVLPLVSTEVSNNVLHVRNLRGYSTRDTVQVRIEVPDIDSLDLKGAGTIDISSIKNEKFGIDSSGAPTIRASGETKALEIDATGAGKIDTHKLRAAKVVVDSKGVSRVEVYAGEQLDATVSGPSQITYRGDPVVNKRIHGPGSIEKRESGPA